MRVALMSSRPSLSVLCLRYLYLILIVCHTFLHKCNARPLGMLSSTNPATRISFHKGSDFRFIDKIGIREKEKDENQWQYGFHKKAGHADRGPAPAPAPVVEQVSHRHRRTDMTKAKASAYDLKSSKERLAGFDGGGGGDEKLASKNAVSWQVPGKSQRQKHPGVYSDYPKPRPRPPTHN